MIALTFHCGKCNGVAKCNYGLTSEEWMIRCEACHTWFVMEPIIVEPVTGHEPRITEHAGQ
jgi:hypothetical protein